MLIENELPRPPLPTMQSVDAIEVKRPHRDRFVQLSHEMPDETAETSARVLIRSVPLIYGFLLGAVLDDMLIGLSVGSALTITLDMRMGRFSIFLPLLRPLLAPFCPLVDAVAHGLAWLLRSVGLPAPGVLSRMRCRLPRT